MYGHAAVIAGIAAGSAVHRELYLAALRQLYEYLAHCVVGDLDALAYQLLVDGGALQVFGRLRSLPDQRPPLTDDGLDLPAQLPAHIFGHALYPLVEPEHPPPPRPPLCSSTRLRLRAF